MSRYYIADNHYGHSNVIRMDGRPFKDIEEMNETMLNIHNSIIKKNDEIVFLGDFSFMDAIETEKILKRMNGKKYLIIGNHDYYLKDKNFDRELFVWIKEYAELNDNNRKVCLSHYPMPFYKKQYSGNSWMLYGHLHNTKDEKIMQEITNLIRSNTKNESKYNNKNETIPANLINCFCKFSDYKPLTLDQWIINCKNRGIL